MNKNVLIIILVVVVLVILGVIFFRPGTPVTAPTTGETPGATLSPDSTGAINQELESVDLGNLDAEFQSIDSDLNSL